MSESVDDTDGQGHIDMAPWPLERYGQAAYHLGQLNGAYLTDRLLPTYTWLFREYERMSKLWTSVDVPANLDLIKKYQDNPWVRRLCPPEVAAGLEKIWAEREMWLSNLYDRLPQTFGHLDAARANLLARHAPDGTDEIIAIDWQLSGIGAIGQELAPLIVATLVFGNVEIDKILELEKVAIEGYLAGLGDAGWNGDVRLAKYGYIALTTVSWTLRRFSGMFVPVLVDEKQHAVWEQLLRRPMSEIVELSSALLHHMVRLADEGRNLAREVF